jgi:hypothetical protein
LDAETITSITITRLLDWYFEAHRTAKALGKEHGLSTRSVAGIIAAMSPRCSWENNLDDTRLILESGENNGFFSFEDGVGKALWIIDGEDPDTVLGGRKVRSFWRNIADPDGSLDVTLDSWMGRCLTLPAGGRHAEQGYLDRAGVYDAIADGFRTVAADHAVMPHQLQASLWLAERE